MAFGDAHTDTERCVLAGYDTGDLKLFDLRNGQLRWQTCLGNGVCGVQFDRRGIPQNKFAAACLESQYHVFDARTLHPVQVCVVPLHACMCLCHQHVLCWYVSCRAAY